MDEKIFTDTAFGIKLRSIELLNGSLVRPENNPKDLTSFLFNVRIDQDIDKNKKLVFTIVHVDIHSIQSEKDVGSISVSHIYEIANFDDTVNIEPEDKFTLPEGLTDILNSISISTTRGVMFSTFKGTFLHHAMLPIVNPKQIESSRK
jgi:hypothetical protein